MGKPSAASRKTFVEPAVIPSGNPSVSNYFESFFENAFEKLSEALGNPRGDFVILRKKNRDTLASENSSLNIKHIGGKPSSNLGKP